MSNSSLFTEQPRNPYSLNSTEDFYKFAPSLASTISGSVHSFPNKVINHQHCNLTWLSQHFFHQVLSNLFAVKSELCGKKFEIKINDIRFVGHPLLLYQHGEGKAGTSQNSIISFNIVFALKVSFIVIKASSERSDNWVHIGFSQSRSGQLLPWNQ